MTLQQEQQLHLDPRIATWVLIPITIIMLLVGIARHYLVSLLNSPPKAISPRQLREQRALMRGQLLRASGRYISRKEYAIRQELLMVAYQEGTYLAKAREIGPDGQPVSQPPPNPLDPAAMDGMMGMFKKQAVMFIPQSILMGWINLFFSGFVLTRLPFPLTLRFKSMLQRGVDTADMDVTWVSSLSWYFLNLFGLNSIYTLVLGGDNAADQTKDMQAANMAMPGVAMPGAPAQDYNKLFNAERENLEIVPPEYHRWVSDDVEDRLLKKYRM